MVQVIQDGVPRNLLLGENTQLANLAAAKAANSAASVGNVVSSLTDWTAKTLTYTKGQRVKADGTLEAGAGYAIFGCAIDGSDQAHRITIYTVGSGFRVASYYSDPAGDPASFISASTEAGNVLRDKLALTVPTNARYVRFNSSDFFAGSSYVVPVFETQRTIATATQMADTRARLLTTAPLANAPTLNANQRLVSDGTVVNGATGYGNALVVLAADTTALVIDTYMVGTGNPVIVWYSNAAGTTLLAPGVQAGGASATRVQATVARPAGAVSARIGYLTAQPYSFTRIKRISSVAEVVTNAGLDTLPARVTAAETSLSAWSALSGLTTVDDAYINRATGAIVTGFAGFQYTIVPVSPGDRIRVDQARLLGTGIALAVYYSDTGATTYISRQYDGTTTNVTIGTTVPAFELTIPANCRAIGICGRDNVPLIISKLTLQTDLGIRVGALAGLGPAVWSGMPWASFGDSITEMGRWQGQLMSTLGLGTHTNCGIGGSRVAKPDASGTQISMCDDARINAIPTAAEMVIVMGGTNDFGQSTALGSLTAIGAASFDNTTFYGALETVATKLLARLTTGTMIVFMTPPLGRWDGRLSLSPTPWPNPYTNLLGLRIEDYGAAVKAVAAKYGFPCIDLRQMLGWNTVNLTQFLDAETNIVHPSADSGGPRMGAVIANYLQANLSRTAAIVNV